MLLYPSLNVLYNVCILFFLVCPQRENQELKNEKWTLNSQLLDEKRKRNEFEALLQENYEKQIAVEDQTSALQRQLQEERESRSQLVAKLQEENQSAAQTEIKKVESRIRILEDEKCELLDKVKKLESLQHDLSRSMTSLDKEKTEQLEKEKQLSQRIKKYVSACIMQLEFGFFV